MRPQPKAPLPADVARRLRAACVLNGLTLKALGDRIDMPHWRMQQILSGYRPARAGELDRIAAALTELSR